MPVRIIIALLVACVTNAAFANKLPAGAAKTPDEARKACIAMLKKKAAGGDGMTAKTLAIYYGDEQSRHVNPALALRYLKQAIGRGVDVSDVPRANAGNIVSACGANPPHKAAAAPEKKNGAAGAKTPAVAGSAIAVKAMPKPAKKSVERPGSGAPAVPAVMTAGQYERLATDAEWNGKVQDAVGYWQRAREGGSRPAAKRLYQIYSFGAGDVEADYVKAIEAAEYARKLGLDVPALPRK